MNKSYLTNGIASAIFLISFALPQPLRDIFLYAGLFALSGALTNLLAIHMLFHKIPLLYGSGVIELRFEAFKNSIRAMMMEQFFTKEQLDNFFASEQSKIDLSPIIEQSDFTPAYEALTKTVLESPFGGMLGMFGGEKALESLKEPFVQKLKNSIMSIVSTEAFATQLESSLTHSTLSDDMIDKVSKLIDQRLDELTPQMVKQIVQAFIQQHLGWLVVWGGFFGGIIGVVTTFLI